MDFLNQSFAQIAEVFRGLTPGARITSVLLVVLTVVSLAFLVGHYSGGPDLYLESGYHFPSNQMPVVEAALGKAGLSGHVTQGGQIRVPRSQQARYMAVLAENDLLPQNAHELIDKAISKVGSFGDRHQRDEAIKLGRQRAVSEIIRKMKGVQDAVVLYDKEVQRGLKPVNVATASVSVSMQPGQLMTEPLVAAVRGLVARSFAGLPPDQILVVDLNSGVSHAGHPSGVGGGDEDVYAATKRRYEEQWKDKIFEALSTYIPGVNVTANVELDRQRARHKETLQHDPKAIAVQVSEKSRTSNTEPGGPGGRPGYAAQQPNAPLSLASSATVVRGAKQEQEESETQTTNIVGSTREVSDEVGLTPTRVTAAIGVPETYFLKVWRARNQASAAGKAPDAAALDQIRTEEIAKIKEHVTKIIPASTGPAADLIRVTSFQDLPQPELSGPTFSEQATTWLAEQWTTVGLFLLAALGLLMLRSLIRHLPVPAALPPRPSPGVGHEDQEEPEESAPGAAGSSKPSPTRLKRLTTGGPSLRDELSQLVQEDPEAAASVLRTWIGAGSSKS